MATDYTNPRDPGSLGGVKRFRRAQPTYISTSEAQRILNHIPAYTKHKERRKNFRRNPVIVLDSRHQFQADLMDMTVLASKNKNCKFVLVVVDCFSKKVNCQLIKSKSGIHVRDGLEKVFDQLGIPKKLQTDKGKEFYNQPVEAFLKEHHVTLFSSENDEIKASMAERMIKTLRSRLWRLFEAQKPSVKYWDKLRHLVDEYNATPHSAHQIAPDDVTEDNSLVIFNRLYEKLLKEKPRAPALKIGTKVRINSTKDIYAKGYEPNFQDEICTVSRVVPHNPEPVYEVREPDGQVIIGKFYRHELAKCE